MIGGYGRVARIGVGSAAAGAIQLLSPGRPFYEGGIRRCWPSKEEVKQTPAQFWPLAFSYWRLRLAQLRQLHRRLAGKFHGQAETASHRLDIAA